MKKIIIVDIDETVANATKRFKIALNKSNNKMNNTFWEIFSDGKNYEMDSLIKPAKKILTKYLKEGGKIIYLSGRRKSSLKYSIMWLHKNRMNFLKIYHREKGTDGVKFKIETTKKIIKFAKDNNLKVIGSIGDNIKQEGEAAFKNKIPFFHLKNYDDWKTKKMKKFLMIK